MMNNNNNNNNDNIDKYIHTIVIHKQTRAIKYLCYTFVHTSIQVK